jgi:hypothetical protein
MELRKLFSGAVVNTPYMVRAVGTAAAYHQSLTFNTPTMQAHSAAGLFAEFVRDLTIVNPYGEGNPRTAIFGDTGVGRGDVKRLNVLGGNIQDTKGLLLSNVEGAIVTNFDPESIAAGSQNLIEIGRAGGVVITGNVRSDAGVDLYDLIRYNADWIAGVGVMIIDAGRQDGYGVLLTPPSITLFDSTLGSIVNRRHWRMTVDGMGSWVSTEWEPTSA